MESAVATVLQFVIRFLVFVPAIVVHEVSHGYSAYLMGDPTAKQAGRLTLNPLKHVDLFGTILLPLMLLVTTGGRAVFGYAKPVPFNPVYFKDRRTGTLITGLAGPMSNLALAIASALVLRLMIGFRLDATDLGLVFADIVDFSVYVNLLLMFFNLLPIPGLDGSHVVQRFLSPTMRARYVSWSRYGMIILFGLLFLAPQVIWTYFDYTLDPVYTLLTGLPA